MQSYSKKELKCHPVSFANALEEYKARNRELFGIKEIDRLLSFSEKKNICIVDKLYPKSSFICSIVAQFCIDYCRDIDRNKEEEEEEEENKTILIDAGNGNNLGYVYISLVKNAFKSEVNVRKILDRTMITRAFTFQQLANIVLKEMPTLIQKMDCNIQVIVMGFLETLASSSSSSITLSSNQNKSSSTGGSLGSNVDFEPTVNLLDEIVDQLIEFSDKYFVIVHYNAHKILNLRESFIPSKFNNSVELIENDDMMNSEAYGKIRVIQKTRSNMPNEKLLSKDNRLIH